MLNTITQRITLPVIVMLLMALQTSAQRSSSQLTADINAANAKFVDMFSQGDGSAALLYAENAVLCPPNSDFIRGMDSIRDFWRGAFNAGIKKVILQTLTVESSGPIAQETGKYTLFDGDGKLLDTGKYVVVWKKEKGDWKMYRDIWNTSAPAK